MPIPDLKLTCLSLRYSSWSMRPWIVLTHVGAEFESQTVSLPHMMDPTTVTTLAKKRELGSMYGLFPVLKVAKEGVDPVLIHESLAICEYIAEMYPNAHLWPKDPLDRAQARAICCQMISGFPHVRNELSCHIFARVQSMSPSEKTKGDIEQIFEIWSERLKSSGGPFLFGEYFGIADAMYFPVVTRFRTYNVMLPDALERYAKAVEALPAIVKFMDQARLEPDVPIYDDYIRKLGGNPTAAL